MLLVYSRAARLRLDILNNLRMEKADRQPSPLVKTVSQKRTRVYFGFELPLAASMSFSTARSIAFEPGLPTHFWRIVPAASMR